MPLDDVAIARKDDAVGRQPSLEHVADRVERRVVRSRHDEFREACRRERRERYLRLPRPAFDRERTSTLLELGRERRRWVELRADRLEELPQKSIRVAFGGRRVQPRAGGSEGVDRRIAGGN